MKRIDAIADFISPYKSIADIGCDHGYVIKQAFDKGYIDNAYAIDNKLGPINRAKDTLKDYKNVKYYLSDGLDSVDENIDCVIIAGMGGMLIIDILEKNKDKLNYIKRLIIEANKDEFKVRKYLTENSFYIYDEKIVEEDNKFYEIDVFEKGNKKYSFNELYFGKVLIDKKEPTFLKKWEHKFNKYKDIKAYTVDEDKIKIMEGIKEILCK